MPTLNLSGILPLIPTPPSPQPQSIAQQCHTSSPLHKRHQGKSIETVWVLLTFISFLLYLLLYLFLRQRYHVLQFKLYTQTWKHETREDFDLISSEQVKLFLI